jgi:hypothetical protein
MSNFLTTPSMPRELSRVLIFWNISEVTPTLGMKCGKEYVKNVLRVP